MMIVMFLNIMVTSQFLHRQQAKNLTQMTQNSFVEARVMLDKEKSHSKQKIKSRANRQKARADYIAGKPGHHLDVSAEELHEDQELDDSLPVGERRRKWVLTNLLSRMVCCIREPEI